MPLHIAAFSGDIDTVEVLVWYCSYIDEKDCNGWTPLHFAAQQGHVEVLRTLLREGADIHAVDVKGQTSLHKAAVEGHPKAALLLVQKGANALSEDYCEKTALDMAKTASNHETIHVLEEFLKNSPKSHTQSGKSNLSTENLVLEVNP